MKPLSDNPNLLEDLTPLLIEVQRDLDEELDLESLATRAGYSLFHFHRLFKAATGETPRQYVERLRLEKAAYKLAITGESVLEIGLSTGFKNHETFCRAFRRKFNLSPSRYRAVGRIAQTARLERTRDFRGTGCVLSKVRFVTLRRLPMLAIRHLGNYYDVANPFAPDDRLWNRIVGWSEKHRVEFQRIAVGLYHDDPEVTPASAQRCDACVPIRKPVTGTRRIRCLNFEGGLHGVIEHTGPESTLVQGFHTLADAIRRSKEYEFRDGPAVEVCHESYPEKESVLNRRDLHLPVQRVRP